MSDEKKTTDQDQASAPGTHFWNDGRGLTFTMIAVCAAVIWSGFTNFMSGIQAIAFGSAGILGGMLEFDWLQDVGQGIALNGGVRVAVGIAQMAGGVGMLLMRGWGWWVALIATGVLLINRLLGILIGDFNALDWLGMLGLIVPGVLLALLLLPRVRERYLQ